MSQWAAIEYVRNLTRDQVTHLEKLLCWSLAWRTNPASGAAWPSVALLAREVMTSTRHVRRIRKHLEEKGILKVLTGGGAYRTNQYSFPLATATDLRRPAFGDRRPTETKARKTLPLFPNTDTATSAQTLTPRSANPDPAMSAETKEVVVQPRRTADRPRPNEDVTAVVLALEDACARKSGECRGCSPEAARSLLEKCDPGRANPRAAEQICSILETMNFPAQTRSPIAWIMSWVPRELARSNQQALALVRQVRAAERKQRETSETTHTRDPRPQAGRNGLRQSPTPRQARSTLPAMARR
jgi:hypothetical protein